MMEIQTNIVHNRTPYVVAGFLTLWFSFIVALGRSGVLASAPAQTIGGFVIGATLLLGVLALAVRPLRAWLIALPMRVLVLMHFVRLVGIAFLVASDTGGLSPVFAERAAYGDVFAAITALILVVAFLPATTPLRKGLLLVWNIVGTIDLLLAVGTGVSIQLSGGSGMEPIVTAPLMYIPFYLVPLLLFGHLLIYYRIFAGALQSETQ